MKANMNKICIQIFMENYNYKSIKHLSTPFKDSGSSIKTRLRLTVCYNDDKSHVMMRK